MAVSITKPPLDLAHVQEWEQAISRLDADYRRHLELLETTLDLHTRSIEQYRSDHRHAQDRLDILGRILDAHITAFTSHQKLAEEQRARQERIRRALAHELLQAREENDRLKLKAAKVASGRWMRLGRFLRLASPLAVLFVIAANAQGQVIGPVVGTSSANPAYVNCVTGCSASSGPSFGSAFPSSGTPIGATDGVNMQPVKVDGSGNLLVNVAAGSGGTPTGPAGT